VYLVPENAWKSSRSPNQAKKFAKYRQNEATSTPIVNKMVNFSLIWFPGRVGRRILFFRMARPEYIIRYKP
jgi:hypothetical protein